MKSARRSGDDDDGDDGDDGMDAGYAWVVLMASFLLCALVDGFRFSFGLFFVEFVAEFDTGKASVAWVGSLTFGLLNVAAPGAGALINRFGCRLTVVLGSILTCLGFALSSLAPSVYVLYVTLGIFGGSGLSMLYVASNVALAQYFKRRRSLAFGLAMAGSGIGGFTLGPLIETLIEQFHWRGAILLLAGIMLNGCVAGALIRPKKTSCTHTEEPLKPKGQVCKEEISNNENGIKDVILDSVEYLSTEDDNDLRIPAIHEQLLSEHHMRKDRTRGDPNTKESIATCIPKTSTCTTTIQRRNSRGEDHGKRFLDLHLLKDFRLVLFGLSKTFLSFSFMIPFTFLPDHTLGMGVSRFQTAWLISIISICNMAGKILVGVVGDAKFVNRRILYISSFLMCGLICLLMPVYSSYSGLVVFCVVLGLSLGAQTAMDAVVLSDLFGDEVLSSTIGLTTCFRAPGNFFGTPLGGWIVDMSGRLDIPFVVSGLGFVASAACIGIVLLAMSNTCRRTRPPSIHYIIKAN